jgi:hypothetical protein
MTGKATVMSAVVPAAKPFAKVRGKSRLRLPLSGSAARARHTGIDIAGLWKRDLEGQTRNRDRGNRQGGGGYLTGTPAALECNDCPKPSASACCKRLMLRCSFPQTARPRIMCLWAAIRRDRPGRSSALMKVRWGSGFVVGFAIWREHDDAGLEWPSLRPTRGRSCQRGRMATSTGTCYRQT